MADAAAGQRRLLAADEYAWRYNHRNDRQAMFFTLLGNVTPAQ